MQTFLPYPSFLLSAKALDKGRLWKQVVECDQILGVLYDTPTKSGKPRTGWKNHPAVRMWRNHELALSLYRDSMLDESLSRGINTSETKIVHPDDYKRAVSNLPSWFGDEKFHLAHQSNLLRKDFDYYSPKFAPFADPSLPYIWPV